MDSNKTYETFARIILAATRIDYVVAAALSCLIKIEDKNQRVFFALKIITPMTAAKKAELLCSYLKQFRPAFFNAHKDLLQLDLGWVRDLRNKCGHGVLAFVDNRPPGHLLSVHQTIKLENISPPPRHISQQDLDRLHDIENRLTTLLMGPILADPDEVEFKDSSGNALYDNVPEE